MHIHYIFIDFLSLFLILCNFQELQDRLDGITREPSPVKQTTRLQPGRGRKASPSPQKVTVARLARQLKKELHQNSQEITPMALRNGKVKLNAH